jgi:hypothetical protein
MKINLVSIQYLQNINKKTHKIIFFKHFKSINNLSK